MNRKCYITPSHFLDFVSLFIRFVTEEKESLPKRLHNYETGLTKMVETKEIIEKLQIQITENKKNIELSVKENEILKENLE